MPGDLYQRSGIKETLTGRAESIPNISEISLRTLLKDVKGMNNHPFASLQNEPNHVKYPLKPEGITESGRVPVMASVSEPGSESGTEAAHRAWEQVQRNAEEWGRQVDAFRPHRGKEARQPRP